MNSDTDVPSQFALVNLKTQVVLTDRFDLPGNRGAKTGLTITAPGIQAAPQPRYRDIAPVPFENILGDQIRHVIIGRVATKSLGVFQRQLPIADIEAKLP